MRKMRLLTTFLTALSEVLQHPIVVLLPGAATVATLAHPKRLLNQLMRKM